MARITRPIVRQIDRAGAVGITVGGVGIIAAVLVIMLYLAWNVAPLFKSGVLYGARSGKVQLAAPVVDAVADEYKGMIVALLADGRAQPVDLSAEGGKFTPLPPMAEGMAGATPGAAVSAVSVVNEYGQMALGYADGSVQIGAIGTKVEFIDPKDVDATTPEGLRASKLRVGERAPMGGGYAEMTPQAQLRVVKPSYTLNKAAALTTGGGAVVRVDFRSTSSAQFLVTARADGTVEFSRVTIVRPLGAGKPRASLTSLPVAFAAPQGKPKNPDYLFALGEGTNILAVWKDGTVQRYALKEADDGDSFVLAETVDLVEGTRTVTAARLLLGSKTLVIADDTGGVRAAFPAKVNTMKTVDGWAMAVAHRFEASEGGGACSALGIALRDRTVVMGDAKGGVSLRHVTSEKLVAEHPALLSEPVTFALVAPKGDGVIALGASGGLATIDLDPGHAEASVKALFGKVWYEGDAGPSYTYQASTGEDTAEVKYSNVPLVFGTIKSTVYAMLFAVPLAIMAALYTSEFLNPKVKNRVKPVIEMMASLPSVVLGFLVSIVIAPLFRDYLPGVMMSIVVLPVGVLTAAYLWQLLPVRVATRVSSLQHLTMVLLIVLVSGAASLGFGRVMERALFSPSEADMLVLAGSTIEVPRDGYPAALQDKRSIEASDVLPFRGEGLYYASGKVVRPTGSLSDPKVALAVEQNDLARADMRLWLDGLIGTPRAGWMLVMTPVGLLLAAGLRSRLLDPRLESMNLSRAGMGAGAVEIGKFAFTLAAGVGLAALLAMLLAGAGFDSRHSIFGGYSQRNTLVVGVAMGFAIIPIIYTISEDSLSAVPGQLRSASLGCGATRWQTATRVVLPIALSGIFSAVMIGLGRAAGETMIVLMSTGNTPNMDWNIFSGFRTLAANIATEMPEAPKDSTHYRALFLSALCLFALTFLVNTVAEVVRQRVRRARAAL